MTHVSVAMATYNGEQYLPAQLESILEQLEPDDEIVVIDDASTDGTLGYLRRIAQIDPRLCVEVNRVNQGVKQTFERALSLTRHDIIFFADQDDVWLPGKRSAFVEAFERDATRGIVISDARVVDGDGREQNASFMATKGGFKGGFLQTVVRSRYLGCSMALRRNLMQAGLPIPAQVPMHDMWFGALGAMVSNVIFLPQQLMLYRRHLSNASPDTPQGLAKMLRWRLLLLWCVVNRVIHLQLRRVQRLSGEVK